MLARSAVVLRGLLAAELAAVGIRKVEEWLFAELESQRLKMVSN